MKTLLFDLDGTLADTSGDLIDAANACLQEAGVDTSLEHGADASIALCGGRAMLRLGLERCGRSDDEEIDRLYPLLLEHYSRSIDLHTRIYPGAIATIQKLRQQGVQTGICTNKPEALAEKLLSRLGIRALFGPLIGADSLERRKPHPEPLLVAIDRLRGSVDRCIMLGDSITDHRAARAAGVFSVLVTFAPHDHGLQRALGPDATLASFHELPAIVDSLTGPARSAHKSDSDRSASVSTTPLTSEAHLRPKTGSAKA